MGGFDRNYYATQFFVTHSHIDHSVYLPDVQPARIEGRDPCKLFLPVKMEKYARNYLHAFVTTSSLLYRLYQSSRIKSRVQYFR